MDDVYEHHYANVHRGVYTIAPRPTDAYEGARDKVRGFVNARNRARSASSCATRPRRSTSSRYSYGDANSAPGDVIVLQRDGAPLEHRAVAAAGRAHRRDAALHARRPTTAGSTSTSSTRSLRRPRASSSPSCTSRTRSARSTRSREIVATGRTRGAPVVVVDGAQSAPHRPVDVQALGCDFFAFSGHKLLRPDGRRRALGPRGAARGDAAVPGRRRDDPLGRARETSPQHDLPRKFEAGTPAIAERVGLGAAIDYLEALGMDAIAAHEPRITELRLRAALGRRGPDDPRPAGRPTAAASSRSRSRPSTRTTWRRSSTADGVCVRAGHHCTQPLMRRFGVAGDDARELLPVHGRRGDRPSLRRARGRPRACSHEWTRTSTASRSSTTTRARATAASSTRTTPPPRARTRSAATRSRSTCA